MQADSTVAKNRSSWDDQTREWMIEESMENPGEIVDWEESYCLKKLYAFFTNSLNSFLTQSGQENQQLILSIMLVS